MNFNEGPFVHGLFCEQVRDETAGTRSYIGVRRGDVAFAGDGPFLLRELTAVAWIVTPTDYPSKHVSFRLSIPGAESIIALQTDTPEPADSGKRLPSGATRRTGTIFMHFGPVKVPEEGSVILFANIDDQDVEVTRIRVRKRSSDTVSTVKPSKKRIVGKSKSASLSVKPKHKTAAQP